VQLLGAADLAAESDWVSQSGYRAVPNGTFLFLWPGYRYVTENDDSHGRDPSENGVMENESLEGIPQHCSLPRIVLANVMLDPSLPVAARIFGQT
jgi:hypothetical protein